MNVYVRSIRVIKERPNGKLVEVEFAREDGDERVESRVISDAAIETLIGMFRDQSPVDAATIVALGL